MWTAASRAVPVTAARNMGANVAIAVDISARPAKLPLRAFLLISTKSLNIMSVLALNQELKQGHGGD